LSRTLSRKVKNELETDLNDSQPIEVSMIHGCSYSAEREGHIIVDGENFFVKNSFDACQLVGNLLGPYKKPSGIIKANIISYALVVCSRIVNKKLSKYILPF
jgi:hypothetical protein